VKETKPPTNVDVAVYALYLLGGTQRRVHTEEIALKAHELSPRQFSWHTRHDLPDAETARMALSDAQKRRYGAFVSMEGPSQRQGMWMLTERGLAWLDRNEARLRQLLTHPETMPARDYESTQLSAVIKHPAFLDFRKTGSCRAIEDYQFAESLRCTVNTAPNVLRARFQEVRTLAAKSSREDVLRYLDACESKFPEMLDL